MVSFMSLPWQNLHWFCRIIQKYQDLFLIIKQNLYIHYSSLYFRKLGVVTDTNPLLKGLSGPSRGCRVSSPKMINQSYFCWQSFLFAVLSLDIYIIHFPYNYHYYKLSLSNYLFKLFIHTINTCSNMCVAPQHIAQLVQVITFRHINFARSC